MHALDDVSSLTESDNTTPPLSPSKTISTEGWSSPRTPGSPYKSRSCLSFQNNRTEAAGPFFTPPPSPTKLKIATRLGNLVIPEVLSPKCDATSPDSTNYSPSKRDPPSFNLPTHRSSLNVACTGSRSLPTTTNSCDIAEPLTASSSGPLRGLRDGRSSTKQRLQYFSSSDSSIDALVAKYATPPPTPVDTAVSIDRDTDDPTNSLDAAAKVERHPIRASSSPLRPSQWASRGGLLSSQRKCRANTPDRFIHCRRPPVLARESFELNKPNEREQLLREGRCARGDPFSRRVRRSDRLNTELQGLREVHTINAGRSGGIDRSLNSRLRGNSRVVAARQISAGAIWSVGGVSAVSDTVAAISTGNRSMLGSGTVAPLYTSVFLDKADPEAELETYKRRLALALEVDQIDRVLQHSAFSITQAGARRVNGIPDKTHIWRDGAWGLDGVRLSSLLDAPQLRDDYYCTLLAYSDTANCLAVGLRNYVHLWSEREGASTPEALNSVPNGATPDTQHVTSLDFSSTQGGQAILAVGRADGRIVLWSFFDPEPRFDATQPKSVSCVSFRPTTVHRPSLRDSAMTVATEELLIRDEAGHIYIYSIEWPSETQSALFGWHGAMTLLARMTIHTQQICGLAWSAAGDMFASGGNDNNCFLFETKVVFQSDTGTNTSAAVDVREGPAGESIYTVTNRSSPVADLPHTVAKHRWTLNAAVKAIAFCPWHRGLVAVGGGSNDRCIHFYHTRSGTCLATIDCAAQVTSLVWSRTRREIAATFGFAQPEHPYRIAVFAWPSCQQLVAVPWWDENRALCAVAYPRGSTTMPDRSGAGRDGVRQHPEDAEWARRRTEGCLVVAASDMAIRFHEIWGQGRSGAVVGGLLGEMAGSLGGSEILEGLHGAERHGTVIR